MKTISITHNRLSRFLRFLDSDYFPEGAHNVMQRPKHVELDRCIPFIFLHLGCLGVFIVGVSPLALATFAVLYFSRIFIVTAFYHRYFSHRSFSTNRVAQFIFGVLGATSAQRGPLWWAAHHRKHHRESDKPDDIHSPVQRGFWWAHIGWITSSANMPTDYSVIPDLAKYPELVLLNRFDWIPPLSLALILLVTGNILAHNAPQLHTSGMQLVVWGFFISTVLLFHVTCSINSLTHIFGSQRYNTGDGSRNNFLLALATFGEGWHNNHHKFPACARQGFYWWEIDISYTVLKILEMCGLVKELNPVPAIAYSPEKLDSNKAKRIRSREAIKSNK